MKITSEPWRALDEALVEVVRIALSYSRLSSHNWPKLVEIGVLAALVEATGWTIIVGNWGMLAITLTFSLILLSKGKTKELRLQTEVDHREAALPLLIPFAFGQLLTPLHLLVLLERGHFGLAVPGLMSVALILKVIDDHYIWRIGKQ